MSAFVQPDGSINPIFRSYLGVNNEGQLLTRAVTQSIYCGYPNLGGCKLQEAVVYRRHPLLPLGVSFRPLLPEYRRPPEVHFSLTEESNLGDHRNTTRLLILVAAKWSVSPIAPASHRAVILHSVVPRMRPRAGLGTHGIGSVWGAHLHTTTPTAGHLNTPAYVNTFPPLGTHI